jgi:DNA-binding HxlR family transcriptional regulator
MTMKSIKITKPAPLPVKRWYHDACSAAHALELLGERWALLIVRELMFGPRRFAELKAGLPGISANVLTQRLEGLEATGIMTRRLLPPPANAQVYELTSWGYEIEPIIQVISRWAARSPHHDPSLPLSAASLMLSFRTMFSAERAAGLDTTVGFRLGREGFVARVADGGIAITRGEPDVANAVFATDPVTMASIVYGGRSIADAKTAGTLIVTGDRNLAQRFVRLFVLPPKAGTR